VTICESINLKFLNFSYLCTEMKLLTKSAFKA
jgi:hypothetical protein